MNKGGIPGGLTAADLKKNGPQAMAAIARETAALAGCSGPQAAFNLLLQIEVAAGWRKPSLAFYDHNLHLIGGGQKYGCTLAQALQEDFDITLISHRPVMREDLMSWYDLDLSRCRVKVMPLDFFSADGPIDPDRVSARTENPFLAVSRESGNYDFFINNSMLEMVYPLANVPIFVCHFPERPRGDYFYAQHYRHLIYNSRYTASWIAKKWRIPPGRHIYPPVDMEPAGGEQTAKEAIILSVARFETGGSKQQAEMIAAFARLRRLDPGATRNWKLVLCGGSASPNPYLDRLRAELAARPELPVELQVNIPLDELRRWYRRAAVFWHLCGLGQSNPAQVEHFGMSTVEAMQNGCLPVVFDGGGQREIVVDSVSGFLVSRTTELLERTRQALRDPELRRRLGRSARQRGREFSRDVFVANVRAFFSELASAYAAGKPQ